ncbi:hypothetical protein AB0H43_02895 [Hamadaea sp. NPDC050747]|uniref:hypothetical protein n=1 Tax=Hamadaea sp. NPDC050747 TaxID=3155789 RepID=UPI0033C73121
MSAFTIRDKSGDSVTFSIADEPGEAVFLDPASSVGVWLTATDVDNLIDFLTPFSARRTAAPTAPPSNLTSLVDRVWVQTEGVTYSTDPYRVAALTKAVELWNGLDAYEEPEDRSPVTSVLDLARFLLDNDKDNA